MCGRFVSAAPPDEVARYFSVDVAEAALEPSWNVAPSSDVYVVRTSGDLRRLDALHWGLVPFWAKDPKVGNRMINARAESLATNGAFKHAFAKRRCIVPADGFYEWAKRPGSKQKQPYFIHRPDGEPYAFAGLWEAWRPKGSDDDWLLTCTIVTTSANSEVADLHDRMPVILPPRAFDQWLDPKFDDLGALVKLLVPAPPNLTVLHPVSTEVGNVRHDHPHLVDPIDLDAVPDVGARGSAASSSGGQGTLL